MRPTIVSIFLCFLVANVSAQNSIVKCGIDNLVDTQFELLRNKRVVLVTHAAARCQTGRSTAEEFLREPSVTVVRILAPEHGYYGVVQAGAHVNDDMIEGVPTLSLYGKLRRPRPEMISDADVVIVDFQDIGSRSYTYVSTMIEVMEACATLKVPVMILDRPNPLGGVVVDGNVPDSTIKSFVARIPTPYVHGMTLGEIATMANSEGWLEPDSNSKPKSCDVLVVKCKRWRRSMTWEQTGLQWYPTSPNIPSADATRGYAVVGLLGELGFVSIGIGTSAPFTMIGAPDFVPDTILERRLAGFGVIARWGRFKPVAGKHAGKVCLGYHLAFKSDSLFRPFQAAIGLISRMGERYGNNLTDDLRTKNQGVMFVKTSGSEFYLDGLLKGLNWNTLQTKCFAGVEPFKLRRRPYLLYEL